MSIKGRNSDKILQKMTGNNPKQDLINDDVHNLVRFCQLVLKILRGNKIITSIKGRNSSQNFAKNDRQQSQARSCQ